MKIIFDAAWSPDIFYRTGFLSDVDCVYIEDGNKQELYVPGFEYARAQKEVTKVKVKKLTSFSEVLSQLKAPFEVPSKFPYGLASQLKGEIIEHKEMFPERRIKSTKEVREVKKVQQVAREAIDKIITKLKKCKIEKGIAYYKGKKVTSEQLKFLARCHLIENGMDCPEIIVSSGKQTTFPHNRGSGAIRRGPVIIDCFPQSQKTRYHGDMTRTFIVGEHKRGQELLEAVQHVHDLCVKKCVSGQRVDELHDFSIEELKKLGFESGKGKGMIHALGHGVGLAVHERPLIGPRDDTVLQEGMTITIEPGLYYDVGVRHENIVVVGKRPRIL